MADNDYIIAHFLRCCFAFFFFFFLSSSSLSNISLVKWRVTDKMMSEDFIVSNILDLSPMQMENLVTLMKEKELVTSVRSWRCAACHL